MRIWDCGKSESHPVMGWIGKDFLTRKCADFHMVAHYEKVGGISYERESNRTLRCVRLKMLIISACGNYQSVS
jgi:hypothetical protein